MNTYWHMSFVDVTDPNAAKWLGGLNLQADTFTEALTLTHLAGLNPGGEVQAVGFRASAVDLNYLGRLITDPNEWRNQPTPPDAQPLEHNEQTIGSLTVYADDAESTPGEPG